MPPGKVIEDKYYIGFCQDGKLIAVMDLIDGYPEKLIVYIGFFMTDISVQGRGIGTEIIDYLCRYLSGLGYESVRLAMGKGEPAVGTLLAEKWFYTIDGNDEQRCRGSHLG